MKFIINSNKIIKRLLLVLLDIFLVLIALIASFSIRLDQLFLPNEEQYLLYVLSISSAILIFYWFNFYDTIIRFIGFTSISHIFYGISIYSLSWGSLVFLLRIEGIPRSVIFINWALLLVIIIGSRLSLRWILDRSSLKIKQVKKIAIYGSGSAGMQLYNLLKNSSTYKVVSFLDDAKKLIGRRIDGVKISDPKKIKLLLDKKNISELFIAIPSLNKANQKRIIDFLGQFPILVKTLPEVNNLINGSFTIKDLHEIDLNDLLGREKVSPDKALLDRNVKNKVIMVTGAGGSIGSEICRQLMNLKPKAIILFESNELALYTIEKELNQIGSMKVLPVLGSVNDYERLKNIIDVFKVQTIYHAAAYKHVPMVEFNTTEGVKNNFLGTMNCAQVAIDCKVSTFVLISTDKAVRPTNTMGASKRLAELILQAFSESQKTTKFSIVRFGNVLGSSGSVIPLFKNQIQNGGPVTVTSKEIIRYFMTIPEAVELVIQAGSMGIGGEVFVLDMGKPVRIYDLAKKMIHLSGYEIKNNKNPNGDIEILISGLRPGEKLYEELLIGDNVEKTSHPMIMKARENMINLSTMENYINKIKIAVFDHDHETLRNILKEVIPEYNPQCGIEDVLYKN